jgi:hypothetical protein
VLSISGNKKRKENPMVLIEIVSTVGIVTLYLMLRAIGIKKEEVNQEIKNIKKIVKEN